MMNPVRKRKLIIVLFSVCVLTMTTLLVLYALRQNISLFYSPEQLSQGKAPLNRLIRIGGMVVPGTIHRNTDSLNVLFDITDYKKTIHVCYKGILPDLFREGQGVVAQGVFHPELQQFKAVEILAKHDENYMPPEVKEALSS